MPCCRRPAAASAAATSLLLLVLLQLLASWPAPPQSQEQRSLLHMGYSKTPHSHPLQDATWRRTWFIYASAKGCCSKKNRTTEEAAAAEALAATTTSSSEALHRAVQGDATLLFPPMKKEKSSTSQTAQDNPNQNGKHGNSGEGSGMPACCGVMPMYFVTTTHTIILFSWWETLKVWQYWISLVICVLLGIFSVLLKVVRMRVERWLVLHEGAAAAGRRRGGRFGGNSMQATGETCCSSKECAVRTVQGEQQDGGKASKGVLAATLGVCRRSIADFPLCSNCCRMVQAFILYGYDYLLMLIVMSFNVGLFFAVTGGLALGFFFFGHLLVYRHHRAHSAPQQQTRNVEMHDFNAGDPLCCGA